MGDHASLVAQQGQPAADEDQGGLAVLAQVAGEPPPERDEAVLADAVRRREVAAGASSGSQESGWSQSTRPAFAPSAIRGSVGSPPFL